MADINLLDGSTPSNDILKEFIIALAPVAFANQDDGNSLFEALASGGLSNIAISGLNVLNIPTVDPSSDGQIWNDSGTLSVSTP